MILAAAANPPSRSPAICGSFVKVGEALRM